MKLNLILPNGLACFHMCTKCPSIGSVARDAHVVLLGKASLNPLANMSIRLTGCLSQSCISQYYKIRIIYFIFLLNDKNHNTNSANNTELTYGLPLQYTHFVIYNVSNQLGTHNHVCDNGL